MGQPAWKEGLALTAACPIDRAGPRGHMTGMLRIEALTYAIAGQRLFEKASAVIPAGHKVGLVGRNGAGKSTLFGLIRGVQIPEAGQIVLPRQTRIGGVTQEAPASRASLLDTVLAADTERAALMADTTTDPARIAEIQTRLADIDAWSAEARAAAILKGLGFDDPDHGRACAEFSGGWRMRVALAAVLFAQPDLLLLDEPTNYLDLEGALWLESYLARYPHTVLVISHDRGLLNRAVGAILHLEERKLTLYQGPYDQFARQRAERRSQAEAMAKKQEARRAHLQAYVDRFRYKADKAKQAQSRLKALARLQPITLPGEADQRKFSFPEPEALNPPIVALENAAVGYDGPPVLKRMDLRIDQDDRIALLGRNGEGKSTLSKLLAGRLACASGTMTTAAKLRVGYFAQHQVDELEVADTALDHLRRLRPGEAPARLRARLAGFGLGAAQADVAVGSLSGGQKARLSLLIATIDAPHLLILDEPTNHLDIESREALVEALTDYTGAVVLVSHDMHLLELVADRLWLVSGGTVRPYTEDLQSYRKSLLSRDAPSARQTAPPKRPSRERLLALRAEARKSEARIETLTEMRDKLATRLADPGLYSDADPGVLASWQRKYAEVMDALDRAEALWMRALEKLERAEQGTIR